MLFDRRIEGYVVSTNQGGSTLSTTIIILTITITITPLWKKTWYPQIQVSPSQPSPGVEQDPGWSSRGTRSQPGKTNGRSSLGPKFAFCLSQVAHSVLNSLMIHNDHLFECRLSKIANGRIIS